MKEITDKERLDLLEDEIMTRHWDGTIGRPPRWYLHGMKLKGDSLREAIDNYIKQKENKSA